MRTCSCRVRQATALCLLTCPFAMPLPRIPRKKEPANRFAGSLQLLRWTSGRVGGDLRCRRHDSAFRRGHFLARRDEPGFGPEELLLLARVVVREAGAGRNQPSDCDVFLESAPVVPVSPDRG